MIGEQLNARLSGSTTITNLVESRIYPLYIKQGDKEDPQLVYEIRDVDDLITHGGVNGLTSADATITCVGRTYAQAETLARAVKSLLNGDRGTWGSGDAAVAVQGCFLREDGVTDDVYVDPQTEQLIYHLKVLTFQVWYS